MKDYLSVILFFLIHAVKLLSNDFPHSSFTFSTSKQYFWTDVRIFYQNMKYDKDNAKKTTTALHTFIEYHPARDTMYSPPNATAENYEDILEHCDKIDEKSYENGFLFYCDVY